MAAGAAVLANSVVGASAAVEENAVVDGSILWPDCVVGAGATVRGAVLGRRARIEKRMPSSGPGAVLGDDSVVTAYSKL